MSENIPELHGSPEGGYVKEPHHQLPYGPNPFRFFSQGLLLQFLTPLSHLQSSGTRITYYHMTAGKTQPDTLKIQYL